MCFMFIVNLEIYRALMFKMKPRNEISCGHEIWKRVPYVHYETWRHALMFIMKLQNVYSSPFETMEHVLMFNIKLEKVPWCSLWTKFKMCSRVHYEITGMTCSHKTAWYYMFSYSLCTSKCALMFKTSKCVLMGPIHHKPGNEPRCSLWNLKMCSYIQCDTWPETFSPFYFETCKHVLMSLMNLTRKHVRMFTMKPRNLFPC